jgi:antitoxin MazE
MEITIRNIGNSKGIVLPKPLLAQAHLEGELTADIHVIDGAIVVRKSHKSPRQGWAQAAAELVRQGDDALIMGEFGNASDEDLLW